MGRCDDCAEKVRAELDGPSCTTERIDVLECACVEPGGRIGVAVDVEAMVLGAGTDVEGAGVLNEPPRERSMQSETWAARKSSALGSALDGSSRWHTGHSSSSARRGGRGRGRDECGGTSGWNCDDPP